MDGGKPPLRDPFQGIWRASLLLLGSVVALNLAIAYVQPVLPWLIGSATLLAVAWVTVAVVRWRRSKW